MARNRRTYKEEPTEEKVLTVDEALSLDRASVLYEKLSEITKSHGVDLLLKIRLIHSDYRTAGFVDDVTSSDEVQSFIDNPEGYLKSHYGDGSYRIDILDGISKKYISHLKIDISSPKEKINRQPDTNLISEVSRAYKEGVNLGKSSTPVPNNHPPLDLTKLIELVMLQGEKSREREEKLLEKIRADEIRLREKELMLIEKAYANNTDLSKHLQPFFESMGFWGKMISNSISMIERTVEFREKFNPEVSEKPFVERLLLSLGERLLESNPQILDRLSFSETNIRKANTPISKTQEDLPSKTNFTNDTEKTKSHGKTDPQAQAHQFNFETLFPALLVKYIKRATRDEDPKFCADSLLADLEDLLSENLISEPQLIEVNNLLLSDQLETYIKQFYPQITLHKAWLLDFQSAVKEGISEPKEDEAEITKQ